MCRTRRSLSLDVICRAWANATRQAPDPRAGTWSKNLARRVPHAAADVDER